MLIAPLPFEVPPSLWPFPCSDTPAEGLFIPATSSAKQPRGGSHVECADDPEDEDEDLGDEEDLAVAQPAADEESSFDDFDDEFDDDFEEEENDPDWDHPDDSAPEAPPSGVTDNDTRSPLRTVMVGASTANAGASIPASRIMKTIARFIMPRI